MVKKIEHCRKKHAVKKTWRIMNYKDYPVVYLHKSDCDSNGGHEFYGYYAFNADGKRVPSSGIYPIHKHSKDDWILLVKTGRAVEVQENGKDFKDTKGSMIASQWTHIASRPADSIIGYLNRNLRISSRDVKEQESNSKTEEVLSGANH